MQCCPFLQRSAGRICPIVLPSIPLFHLHATTSLTSISTTSRLTTSTPPRSDLPAKIRPYILEIGAFPASWTIQNQLCRVLQHGGCREGPMLAFLCLVSMHGNYHATRDVLLLLGSWALTRIFLGGQHFFMPVIFINATKLAYSCSRGCWRLQ